MHMCMCAYVHVSWAETMRDRKSALYGRQRSHSATRHQLPSTDKSACATELKIDIVACSSAGSNLRMNHIVTCERAQQLLRSACR